jgi:hypothetical protein
MKGDKAPTWKCKGIPQKFQNRVFEIVEGYVSCNWCWCWSGIGVHAWQQQWYQPWYRRPDQFGLQFSDIGLISVLPKYWGVEIRDWDQRPDQPGTRVKSRLILDTWEPILFHPQVLTLN